MSSRITTQRITIACLLALQIACSSPAFAVSSYFSNLGSTRSSNISPFTKWTGMMERRDREIRLPDSDCGKTRFHPCSVAQWREMLDDIESKPLRQKLEYINNWSNEHPYIEDSINWGMEDFWETPYQFMAISGDCEDYAISKYYSLRASGVSPDKLRIIIVQDLNLGGIIHAILGVYDGGDLYILDNQIKQVTPALKIFHYRPVYGINEDAWWSYHPRNN
jgi:predicted transglutaminase-like cysteine proteinase